MQGRIKTLGAPCQRVMGALPFPPLPFRLRPFPPPSSLSPSPPSRPLFSVSASTPRSGGETGKARGGGCESRVSSTEGASFERHRREDRGAEGAEGIGCGEGVSPSPLGEGSGEGAVPPPQKIFRFLSSKRRPLVHSGCYFCS